MNFDIPTLMAAGSIMTGISALVLALAWLADREARPLLWWSGANLLIAVGIFLLLVNSSGPPTLGLIAGSFLLDLGPAIIWMSVRIFHGRRPLYPIVGGAVAIIIAAGTVPPINHDPRLQTALSLAISALFFGAAAVELCRPQLARLRARWPLAAFLVIHTTVFAVGSVEAISFLLPTSGLVPFGLFFGLIHFEQLIFVLASSLFVVAMVREASEQRHKVAADVDVLTGVASRRAFFEMAEAALRVSLQDDSPYSLVIFDLDRFKQVNDFFGHAAGDQVLQLFAATARTGLRSSDIIGRLGGEEFAVAMPGSSPGAAYVVADRIRHAFGKGELIFNTARVADTVSAGVATAHPDSTLDRLIEAADGALYRAKTLGRNRVEMVDRPQKNGEPSVVIRVA